MITRDPQKDIKFQVPQGFNVCLHFAGAGGLVINGREYSVNEKGDISPVNGQSTPDLEQRALQVGDRLWDGTVVLSVDLDKNTALFVPEKIFGGKSNFHEQDVVVTWANMDALHHHIDWRRIVDKESAILSRVWDRVAPLQMHGDAAPWFWCASS